MTTQCEGLPCVNLSSSIKNGAYYGLPANNTRKISLSQIIYVHQVSQQVNWIEPSHWNISVLVRSHPFDQDVEQTVKAWWVSDT